MVVLAWAPRGGVAHFVKSVQAGQPAASPRLDFTPRTDPDDAEYVERLADCSACHTVANGQAFAGGLKMGSPLGAIYSTNITPDKATGIGDYTLVDFDLAVRHGVAKDGHRLYPAMPYPSYAKLSDGDVKKLYDFFMHSVQPVTQANKPTEIASPWNQRWPLAFWDLVYAPGGAYRDDPKQDAAWNRGAYLVQSLGHCGACHTPRGAAFQEAALDGSSADYLSGAYLDAWRAPSLRGDVDLGLGRWSEQDVVDFLKTGHNAHATVFGSMLDAFNNSTTYLSDADLAGIAHYLKSLPGAPADPATAWKPDGATLEALNKADFSKTGAVTYMQNCQSCHGRDGMGRADQLPPLCRQRHPCSIPIRRVLGDQCAAQWRWPHRRQWRAGFLPHDAVPGAVEGSADRRRRDVRPLKLGQQGAGGNGGSGGQTARFDRPDERPRDLAEDAVSDTFSNFVREGARASFLC